MTVQNNIYNINEEAIEAYIVAIQKARQLIAELSEYVDEHGEVCPEDVNWSDVANINYLIEQFRDANDFVKGEADA